MFKKIFFPNKKSYVYIVCSTTCGPGKQLRYRRCTHTERQCRVKYEVDEKNCLIKSC